MEVYVIHNGCDTRRKRVKNLLSSFIPSNNINWMIYPNAKHITEDLQENITYKDTHLTKGRISCTYKHYLSMKDMVERDIKMALIMEDNVGNIKGDPISNLQRYLSELEGKEWDVIFDTYYPLPYTEDIVREGKLVYKKDNANGSTKTANFYYINLECAKKLVKEFLPFHEVIDHYMNYLYKKLDIKSYWILPPNTELEENHQSSV